MEVTLTGWIVIIIIITILVRKSKRREEEAFLRFTQYLKENKLVIVNKLDFPANSEEYIGKTFAEEDCNGKIVRKGIITGIIEEYISIHSYENSYVVYSTTENEVDQSILCFAISGTKSYGIYEIEELKD